MIQARTIIQETVQLDPTTLQQQFTSPEKARPLLHWLDPEHYPDLGDFDLADAAEFLPSTYRRILQQQGHNATPREIITQVITHNEAVDQRIEHWLSQAPADIGQGAFYHVPCDPDVIQTKQAPPPPGTLWSIYIVPLLLKKRATEWIPIDQIAHRKLDYTELYSAKYAQMRPSAEAPPALVVTHSELPNLQNCAFTLIEGAFRVTHAQEVGETTYRCKVIPWDELIHYIHLQPIQGGYHYH